MLGGLTAQAGLAEGPGVVRNFGDLPTYIGEMAGGLSERAVAIAKAFTAHGLPVSASADIKRDKWKKLLGNVALGAISAVTDLRSVEIMRVPELQEIVFRAVDEAAAVASARRRRARRRGGARGADEAGRHLGRRHRQFEILDARGHHPCAAAPRSTRSTARSRGSRAQHKVPTPTIDTMIAMVKGLQAQYLRAVTWISR